MQKELLRFFCSYKGIKKMNNMKDSLITASQGVGGVALSFWEVLPGMLRLGILIATLAHIIIKIVKDYNK